MRRLMSRMQIGFSGVRSLGLISLVGLSMAAAPQAQAFCGFYVAKADTQLFNKASKVVLVRDGDRTVLTMVNDFKGNMKEFAMVIPVPTVLEKEQINVGDMKYVDRIDAFTAPRLVEYFDDNPCDMMLQKREMMAAPSAAMDMAGAGPRRSAQQLGVTIEATFTVGEYDIMILSAKESTGLRKWLSQEGYKVTSKADQVLQSYIAQNLKFFVAKVNLKEQSKSGYTYLRPIQIAYESPRFMLPIRLGTVNADGAQDLFIFALTKTGRVESTNYRTAKIPSDLDIPLYVKDKFADFYKSMFSEAVKRESMKAMMLEYAWDMGWCDPCAADPLTSEELRKLGVFWVGGQAEVADSSMPAPPPGRRRPMPVFVPPGGGAQPVYVTRLHLRYTGESHPEDLVFQETGNKENFQGRYIMRHPFKGEARCEAASSYYASLPQRFDNEAKNLARITGWDINQIRKDMKPLQNADGIKEDQKKWWKKIW
ncbi:MAG TPA: DUF2330 domain-containing protein [Pseudobdellovibrionaceae bacterium]|nr:DUF2330 domain-containing protein [Pseudobdellovibrionaceae bacterium]